MTSTARFDNWQNRLGTQAGSIDASGNVTFDNDVTVSGGAYISGDLSVLGESMPRGVVRATAGGTNGVGWAKYTTTQGFTANVWGDVGNLTVSFTADPNRVYRTTGYVTTMAFASQGLQARLAVRDGSGTILNSSYLDGAFGIQDAFLTVTNIESGVSGSITRKISMYPSSGLNIFMSTDYWSWVLVEDIGGS